MTRVDSFIRYCFALCCLSGLAFPYQASAQDAAKGQIKIEENITYGKVGDLELKLDLAQPAGKGPFPAIVCIHGGGWRQGSRASYKALIQEAAKRGYVAVTVTYRLVKAKQDGGFENQFPCQVNDVKCAVRWLRSQAEKYQVDPQRIGAIGGSAGGHLTLMLALTDEKANLEGSGGSADRSSRIQAAVNFFGPTDMALLHKTSPGAAPIAAAFLGGPPEEQKEVYQQSSPLTYVSEDDPPVLTIHGEVDKLVPLEQAKLLDEKMKAAGLSHTLVVIEGQAHGFQGAGQQQAIDATFEFFQKQLKPNQP